MYSMTGMGKSRAKIQNTYFSVEIKSVNHKFCEVNTRLPSRYQAFEIPIVQFVKKRIKRGKVDVWFGEEKQDGILEWSPELLKKYLHFLGQIKEITSIHTPLTLEQILQGMPHWTTRSQNDADELWNLIKPLLEKALDDLLVARKYEGQLLLKFILARLKHLKTLHKKMGSRRRIVLEANKEKLKKRILSLLEGIKLDQDRLLNELAYMADRTDISEELERLSAHFEKMTHLMKSVDSSGRSLDFLIQEMNREWNTIASKSQDAESAHLVVEAKSELEKIREQIQNVE